MSPQECALQAPMWVNGETGIREQQVKGKVRITLALTHSTVRIEQHSRVQTHNSAWDQAQVPHRFEDPPNPAELAGLLFTEETLLSHIPSKGNAAFLIAGPTIYLAQSCYKMVVNTVHSNSLLLLIKAMQQGFNQP